VVKVVNVLKLKVGKRYQVEKRTPTMPAFDLMELRWWQRCRIVDLQPGQRFTVVQVRKKGNVVWYQVNLHWWHLRHRWINSRALIGQAVRLVGPVPTGRPAGVV